MPSDYNCFSKAYLQDLFMNTFTKVVTYLPTFIL